MFVACYSLVVCCCLLCVDCWLLFVWRRLNVFDVKRSRCVDCCWCCLSVGASCAMVVECCESLMLCVVGCVLSLVCWLFFCCTLCVARRAVFVLGCTLYFVRCLLCFVRCLLFAARCLLAVVCWLLPGVCALFVACCVLLAACGLFVVIVSVVACIVWCFFVGRCLLYVVWSCVIVMCWLSFGVRRPVSAVLVF